MRAISEIEANVVAEGARLVGRASQDGVVLRVLGGVAVRLHAGQGLPPALQRSYGDLDLVTGRGASKAAADFLAAAGYEPHVAFNALHGKDRLLFFDTENGRQVDVFVGSFRMCHAIPLNERLHVEETTIPLAELLLTKLQVVQLNEKDIRDALALLHGHAVGEGDRETVNAARVAVLLAEDWGLWRTITANLGVCREHVAEYEISPEEKGGIRGKLEAVLVRIEREPKSRAWRLRAKIGERKRWYELPEEVAGGP